MGRIGYLNEGKLELGKPMYIRHFYEVWNLIVDSNNIYNKTAVLAAVLVVI